MTDRSQQKSIAKQTRQELRRGFTIVELLIVVVVIAILATITIVSYNGITNSAKEATLKSDLSTAAKKLNVEKIESGSFPSSTPSYISDGLAYSGGGNAFCVSGEVNSKSFRITESGNVQEGECTASVATMQTFTASQCSALAIYDGSNPAVIVSLTDSRGGTPRTYEVAKLADNKCWMLNNLKLGSTAGPVTLTPSDSNVASNFTLPQVNALGVEEYDLPRAYGAVLGDTGAGATNYGYLYNFPAATAGETQTSLTAGNASYSICPANWHLPSGGGGSGNEFGDLDIAFGGNGNYASSGQSNIDRWQPFGPFHGVFSGGWYSSFGDQGSYGGLWSSSRHPSYTDSAFGAYFSPGVVEPGDVDSGRGGGLAVRCLLN